MSATVPPNANNPTTNPIGAKCGAALQLTFNTCIQNVFYNPAGTTYLSLEASCENSKISKDPASNPQKDWYGCLCTNAKAVMQCYINSCPDDATRGTMQNSQVSYCQAASTAGWTATTGTVTPPTVTGPPGSAGDGNGPVLGLPGASSTSTTTAAAKSSALEVAVTSIVAALAVFLI